MSDAAPTDRPALHRRPGLFLGPMLVLLVLMTNHVHLLLTSRQDAYRCAPKSLIQ